MVDANYEKILERISKASNLPKEEIARKVEAKIAKLSGLISKEGAAQVVSAELGINFDNEKFKIDELLPGMRKVNITAKVINVFPVRTFERQGKTNKVGNFVVADETSNIKVVLWDTNHIGLLESGTIKEGSVVEISGGGMRDNEIHLGSFSELKPSSEQMNEVRTEKIVREKTIANFKTMDNASIRAFIVQAFEPKFFHVCSECKKKVNAEGDGFICAEHGKVLPEKRALINIVLDDGTETVRAVLFHEKLKSIGLTALEDESLLLQQKQNLLGKEMIFSGTVRLNKFFNNQEFIIDSVKELDLDEVLNNFEK